MTRIATFVLIAAGLAAATGLRAQGPAPTASQAETGLAAVYSDVLHGRTTASGKPYDRAKLTAAHQTLPFGTRVRVTNVANSKSVELTITDRGPTQKGRILDISWAAARALGIPPKVMREVTMEVIELGPAPRSAARR